MSKSMPAQVPDELDAMIDALNNAAGKSPRAQSLTKRKGPEIQEPIASKKRAVDPNSDESLALVRPLNDQAPASRLRSRTSTASRQSLNRKDPFALPDEELEEPVLQPHPSKKPIREAMKRTLKRPTANPSPLKKHGEINVNVAHVNFRESPPVRRKQEVRQVERASKSAKPSTQTATSRKIEAPSRVKKTTNPNHRPAKEGDDEAQREDAEGLDGEEEEEAEEEEAEEEAAAAEKKKKVEVDEAATKKEKAAVKKKRVAKLMEGLEEASNLHGFRSAWEEILFNADSIREMKSDVEAETKEGRILSKRIKHLKNEFKHLNDMNADPQISEPISLVTQINKLKRRVDAFKTPGQGQGERELARRGRDLHQHIVPDLVFLAIKAIDSRQSDGMLDLAGYKEISPLLALSLSAAINACNWEPRPSIVEAGVKSGIRSVTAELRRISKHYDLQLYTLQWPIDETRRLDALEEQQNSDRVSLYTALDRQREQRLGAIQRARQGYGQSQPEISSRRSQSEVTPIPSQSLAMRDRIADQSNEDQSRRSKKLTHRATATASQLHYEELSDLDDPNNHDTVELCTAQSNLRPAVHRQATEEIPGPLQAAWPEQQRYVLITALQTNTQAYRFQEIVEKYGDQLGGRSLDEIVSQAKLIKASMARALETDLKHDASYDWLRSVPAG